MTKETKREGISGGQRDKGGRGKGRKKVRKKEGGKR